MMCVADTRPRENKIIITQNKKGIDKELIYTIEFLTFSISDSPLFLTHFKESSRPRFSPKKCIKRRRHFTT